MRAFLAVLIFLALAALGALLGQWLIEDPGSVRILVRGWRIEMTAVTAAILLLSFLVGLKVVLAALRMPRIVAQRLVVRRAAQGALALLEERYPEAARRLARLPASSRLALPAYIAAARAARAWGRHERAEALLERASRLPGGEAPVQSERAAALLRAGRPSEAVRLLQAQPSPSPAARRILALALAASGEPRAALAQLPALKGALPPERLAALRRRLAESLLAQANDRKALSASWEALPTAAQRDPAVFSAYVGRLAALGAEEEAARLIERRQEREPDVLLAELHAEMSALPLERRLRMAEAWLALRPEQPRLLLILGRLCRRASLWGKGEDYLRRAIAAGAGADAWVELAELHLNQDDRDGAITCFRNAIAVLRSQGNLSAVARLRRPLSPTPVQELRGAFGLPQIPKEPAPP